MYIYKHIYICILHVAVALANEAFEGMYVYM